MIKFILALLALTSALGQTLEVTPSAVDRGSANIFRILLKAPAGKGPAALQWELTVPPEITIEVSGMVAGSAAEGAEKSLTCAAKKTGLGFVCIVAGGSKPIPDGPIAIVRYSAGKSAPTGSVIVRLEKAAGASIDLKKIAIADASGAITIQ